MFSDMNSLCCGKYHASKLANYPLHIEKNNGNTPPVVLALLYGSWTVKLSKRLEDEKDTLPSKIYDALETCNVDATSATDIRNIPCVYTKVDEDDESVDICVNKLECPSELPALVFLCNTTSTSTTSSDELKSQGLRVEHVEFNGSTLENLLTKSTTTVAKEGECDKFGRSIRDAWLRLFGIQCSPKQNVSRHIHSNNISNRNNNEPATRLFIAGDRSQVGKSSICLGLLGALLNSGKYKPTDLAYIKPATQCEQTQLVEEYCKHKGITDCVAVGPIVYYKGFTRAFLKSETGETSEQLLQKASDAVDKLALNKKVIIIDGVGYPAVGSITGTDNASVAKVCGQSFSLPNTATTAANEERSPVPVLLVGKSGVGDAVDSFNINATYFIHRDVPVIGTVFNKLSLDGFYSLSNCKEAIDMYFHQSQPDRQAFGYIPEISSLKNAREHVANNSSKEDQLKEALNVADTFVAEFSKHVNVDKIIIAAKKATAKYIEERTTTTNSTSQTTTLKRSAEEIQSSSSSVSAKHPRTTADSGYKSNNSMNTSSNGFSLTREQIEALASSAGAAGG